MNASPATFGERTRLACRVWRSNGSEMASRAGQKPVIVTPSNKEIFLASVKTIPLRAKVDGDVREFFLVCRQAVRW
jgi:hypothetical protein